MGNTDDVKLAASAATAEKKSGVVPFTPMQRGIARNMEASLSTPVFRLTRKIAIEKHPIMNSSYKDNGIQYNEDINISMAVAIGGELYTPTLLNANKKNVLDLAREWRTLVRKAKKNKLAPEEYTTGTFAISNLGMFGVKSFDAVLPHGMGCILAIGSTQNIVLPDKKSISGSKVVRKMSVTMTCDHRHIYGTDAAKFLQSLTDLLEKEVETLKK